MDTAEQVAALYRGGLSGIQVAKQTGVNLSTVYKMLARAGVETREDAHTRPRSVTPEQLEEIIDMYVNQDKSTSAIAEVYGLSPTGVAKLIRRSGHEIRPKGPERKLSPEDESEVTRLYTEEEQSQSELARRFEVSQSLIRRILNERGVGLRPAAIPSGEGHPNWRGGKSMTGEGYVLVKIAADHPLASMRNRQGYVPEHRFLMATMLGRPLDSHETVHHINGDRADNRVENLQIRKGKHGKGIVFRCGDCGSKNVIEYRITED